MHVLFLIEKKKFTLAHKIILGGCRGQYICDVKFTLNKIGNLNFDNQYHNNGELI